MQQVGEECQQADMPFLLELVSYSLDEGGTDTTEFARRKPDLGIRSAAEFSKPSYNVDILKLEFPADLKWTKEYSKGAFDGKDVGRSTRSRRSESSASSSTRPQRCPG